MKPKGKAAEILSRPACSIHQIPWEQPEEEEDKPADLNAKLPPKSKPAKPRRMPSVVLGKRRDVPISILLGLWRIPRQLRQEWHGFGSKGRYRLSEEYDEVWLGLTLVKQI
jgi:hypothetical protein